MRYDLRRLWLPSPRGRACLMYVREETNDVNTALSCLAEDEYRTRERDIRGVFLDIGGHIGALSVAVLVDHPEARAVIVEAVPENVALIRRNLDVNGVADRATVVEGAVGRPGSEVTISYAFTGDENALHHAYIGNAGHLPPDAPHHSEVTYRALSIAELVPEGDIGWAKVDTEGGEWGFLADPDIGRLATIVGEWHAFDPFGGTGSPARLRDLLAATHEVTFTGPPEGPGGFLATRR